MAADQSGLDCSGRLTPRSRQAFSGHGRLAMDFYHDGMRELQDRYEGRAVADRPVSNRMRKQFNQADREFIESSSFFFLATATPQSVDCSFKGGDPGFVRVIGENVVAWPDPGAPRFDAQSPGKVYIYVDTNKDVGDRVYLVVFEDVAAAEKWFDKHDPEGAAFEYDVRTMIEMST